jgi:hypothetical protein
MGCRLPPGVAGIGEKRRAADHQFYRAVLAAGNCRDLQVSRTDLDVVVRPDDRRLPVGLEGPPRLEDRFARRGLGRLAYVLYKVAIELWEAAVAVFNAFVALLSAFVSVLPYIIAAGLIAFAGGWVIHNVNF